MLDRIIWNHPWSPLLYLIFITNCLMAALVGAPVASVHAIRCERSNYKFKLVHSILITRCIYLFESNGMAIYNGRLNIAVTFQGRFDKSRNKIELVQLPPKDNLLDLHLWNNLTGELDQIAYGIPRCNLTSNVMKNCIRWLFFLRDMPRRLSIICRHTWPPGGERIYQRSHNPVFLAQYPPCPVTFVA